MVKVSLLLCNLQITTTIAITDSLILACGSPEKESEMKMPLNGSYKLFGEYLRTIEVSAVCQLLL